MKVFLLWHTDRFGDEKLIGVYETKRRASAAINRFIRKPGFFERKGVFLTAPYKLNADYWTEGFIRRDGFSLPTWLRKRRPKSKRG